MKPLQSLLYGALAGCAGALVQSLFFRATAKIAPRPPEDAFRDAPEPQQQVGEQPTQTVARRVVEDLLERGPLTEERKGKAANTVHLAFGSGWGAAYGLLRESVPGIGPLAATLGFGTLVWMASDNLILPAFRLSAWPQRYPASVHLYAWTAHLPYAAMVWGAYELLRARPWATVAGTAAAWKTLRRVPSRVRPPIGRVARGVARMQSMRRRLEAARAELTAR